MSNQQTASFMIRFTQQLYKDENGEDQIQWRGKISHVQSGDQDRFVDFEKSIAFMQEHLEAITASSVADKSEEEQEGILSKSFDMWKKIRKSAPKVVLETIKDPMGQVENIQEQIKEQIKDVSEEIGQKIDVDNFRSASRNDLKDMMSMMKRMSKQIDTLTEKVTQLEKE